MSNTSLSRFEQASGCFVPIINPCPEPFTPNDFTHYEHVHALSEGFRDPLIKDWFMADMHHLCSLNVTNFLLAMRVAFLPRSWDRKLRDEIRFSYQGKDESVVEWMSRLRQTNTLLRHTYFHLSNDDLLEHFKTHINKSLFAHRLYPEAAKEDDLMQWILIIKGIEESQDANGGSDSDATQCPPETFKPTDPRLKRKRSIQMVHLEPATSYLRFCSNSLNSSSPLCPLCPLCLSNFENIAPRACSCPSHWSPRSHK
ncbi:hypothetical protein IW262DRAFT_1504513 [Armillaria fumosa]|nr:hypothetical protein IW262DRAFT_1504513 [Armillaria fumosa]